MDEGLQQSIVVASRAESFGTAPRTDSAGGFLGILDKGSLARIGYRVHGRGGISGLLQILFSIQSRRDAPDVGQGFGRRTAAHGLEGTVTNIHFQEISRSESIGHVFGIFGKGGRKAIVQSHHVGSVDVVFGLLFGSAEFGKLRRKYIGVACPD